MTESAADRSPQFYAKVSGVLYLSLMPFGIFGILYVPTTLIIAGDPAATLTNIVAAEGLFRLSIVAAFIVQLINAVLVLFLYQLLKPAGKNWAALMVMFLLVAVPIAMLNELNRLAVLVLIGNGDAPAANLAGQVMLLLDIHESGVFIAQIFWGLWLFPMGYLIYRSTFLPSWIGILLMIGCFGYLFDSVIFFLLPGVALTISAYTFIGEVALPLWLVIKGVDVEAWHSAEGTT